ncbi:hypothetical protein [Mycobacterium palustre]|uniref:Uncharacterized protein n=1 Tax=Mycobacterium palustre TaxID=153971 RepID=A0A1X1ZP90_9MYCO|nr:hypothetical protein [Mycobacterium palustre]ORW25170.1 hypothetical protein AWC19_08255 [Mycobacterium palustre]
MTEVYFEQLEDDWWEVSFDYGPEVVAFLKTVPKAHRNWMPRRKVWEVSPRYAVPVVQGLEKLGCEVFGIRLARADEASSGEGRSTR